MSLKLMSETLVEFQLFSWIQYTFPYNYKMQLQPEMCEIHSTLIVTNSKILIMLWWFLFILDTFYIFIPHCL